MEKHQYLGYVDRYTQGQIFGWVVRGDDKAGGLMVGVFLDGGLVTTAVANHFRSDVREAGIGDGHSGFVLDLPSDTLELAVPHGGEVMVQVMEEDNY
ncbi:MAG: hypothetical protein J0H31_25175, partial [Alphaproteobacteria bacterium]|nr:hypothetical protein [Alphaproteobacteria bacterium]